MPIQIKTIAAKKELGGEVYGPFFVCDECGEIINRKNVGNYLYDSKYPINNKNCFFLHKPCTRIFEARYSEIHFYCDEITKFFIYLKNNYKA